MEYVVSGTQPLMPLSATDAVFALGFDRLVDDRAPDT